MSLSALRHRINAAVEDEARQIDGLRRPLGYRFQAHGCVVIDRDDREVSPLLADSREAMKWILENER